MTDEYARREELELLKQQQSDQGHKLDQVLDSQRVLGETMTSALNRLTDMIEVDIGTRKDVEQLKKDRDTLFSLRRTDEHRIEAIELRDAKFDGAGIFKRFPKVWDWYQQELGIRRFVPAVSALVSLAVLIYVKFFD